MDEKNLVLNDELISEPIDSSTNCLALTVRNEYRLTITKNIFNKSFRVSWKIALSIITLNFLNMFL